MSTSHESAVGGGGGGGGPIGMFQSEITSMMWAAWVYQKYFYRKWMGHWIDGCIIDKAKDGEIIG